MRKTLSALTLCLSLSIGACSAPDGAALLKGDEAFKGQAVDGQLHAVATRSVLVGTGGRNAAACGATATPKQGSLNVYWSNDASGPIKTQVRDAIWVCESVGEWTGIIFPAQGQSSEDCGVTTSQRTPREYQGPCRWGWARTADLVPTEG